MGEEIVTISAGGGLFADWTRVEVQASFQDGARTFTIDAAAPMGGSASAWRFKAGTEVEIFFNGDLVCRGYVDRYQPRISAHDEATISISGRSKSQDMIDSSAKHETGHFKDKTPAEIGQELDKFGVGISADVQLEKVPVCRITPGEKAFNVIERLCRDQGAFPVGQADGSIKIMKAGKARHSGAIAQGKSMLAGSADHNFAGRHSEIVVRGQRPYGSGKDNLQIEATAKDGKIRFRPLIIALDSDTDDKRAKKRAASHRDREAGNSLKANATMQGFRDDGGKVWEPGYLIFFESEFLSVHQDMAIEGATFTQVRNQGSITELSLVDPRALGGKGNKGGEAGDAWGSDAGEDE